MLAATLLDLLSKSSSREVWIQLLQILLYYAISEILHLPEFSSAEQESTPPH